MKFVTFNIRCDYEQDGGNNFSCRKPHILEKINKEKPDIICFQEVLPHVALWLKENFLDYYIIGCGRDENLEDEQTSIAYKKTRFNLMGMETFWLSETPRVPASRYENQSICPRTCTEALFQDMKSKGIFRVYNTHLDHLGSGARTLGLKQILNKMKQENSFKDVPAILTGDFNAFPDSEEMEIFQKYPEYIDISAKTGGTFHDYGKMKEAEKIDYIYADSRFQCVGVNVWTECKDGVYLSDHYPVCAEIRYEQAALANCKYSL